MRNHFITLKKKESKFNKPFPVMIVTGVVTMKTIALHCTTPPHKIDIRYLLVRNNEMSYDYKIYDEVRFVYFTRLYALTVSLTMYVNSNGV